MFGLSDPETLFTFFDIFVNISTNNDCIRFLKITHKCPIEIYHHVQFDRDPDHDPDLRADFRFKIGHFQESVLTSILVIEASNLVYLLLVHSSFT